MGVSEHCTSSFEALWTSCIRRKVASGHFLIQREECTCNMSVILGAGTELSLSSSFFFFLLSLYFSLLPLTVSQVWVAVLSRFRVPEGSRCGGYRLWVALPAAHLWLRRLYPLLGPPPQPQVRRPSIKQAVNQYFFFPSYSRMYKLSMYCGSYCMAKCTATNIAHASIYIIKLFIPAKHYDLQRSVLSRAKMRINVTATSYTSIHVLWVSTAHIRALATQSSHSASPPSSKEKERSMLLSSPHWAVPVLMRSVADFHNKPGPAIKGDGAIWFGWCVCVRCFCGEGSSQVTQIKADCQLALGSWVESWAGMGVPL